LPYLTGLFEEGVGADCEFAVDNNNYAHLACYLATPGEPGPEVPGLEFYVIAETPGADSTDACTD